MQWTRMSLQHPRGKVAVITGGASGIGLALAERCLAEGMRVVIGDYEQAALDEAAARLGVQGVRADVRSRASVEALAGAAMDAFGAAHLLCNNAGVSVMTGIGALNEDDWRWVFDVNLFGTVNGVAAFLPLLKANPEGGHILNTVSLSALYTVRAQAAYAASKAAALSFSETLRLELEAEGGKVGVTALCPGPVRTNIRTSIRNRPSAYGPTGRQEGQPDVHERAFRSQLPDAVMVEARDVADMAFDAVLRDDFWVITHPGLMAPVEDRHREIISATEAAPAARD
jgi:NAD(P)-dependent dehydrogenase (short-subunit alcohol dehydrogenase family)